MTLFLLSYLGGVLTILSPCILPVLPFVFARSDQPFMRSGLPLLGGMALAFAGIATIATVGGNWAIQANQAGRIAAMVLLALFGLTLLVPSLAERLTREEIAWAPCQTLADVAVDPQVHAAGGIVQMPGRDGSGTFAAPASPARFPGVDDGPKGPGPALGQHTREVLAGLGYGAAEIDAMYASKAVA